MKRSILFCAAFALVWITAGCGAARPSKYYQLTVPADSAATTQANPFPVTLLLGTLTSSHLYREDHLVYSSTGENMGIYEYQRWAEPPTEMIDEVLFRGLRSSGRYKEVYSLRSNVHGDYLLHGHLYDFKEVAVPALMARVTLELELRDMNTGTSVWTHFYTHDEPVSGKDVTAVVAALDKNLQRGVSEFEAGLVEYFTAHPPSARTTGQ